MKVIRRRALIGGCGVVVAALACGLLPSKTLAQTAFTPGNIVVSRVGDGTQTLANTGNAVFLDEYTPNGTFVRTLALPSSGANGIVSSGTATSEGMLTLSADGSVLTYAGYRSTGTSSIANSTSASNPRVIASINSSGVVDTSTSLTDAFSGNNPRSAVSVNGSSFYAVGGTSGVRYATDGATTSTSISTTSTNNRVINIYNNNLYSSTGSGTPGIYQVTGLPTTCPQTATSILSTGTGSSPYDFYFADANTVYVADDRSTTSGGGLQKYVFDSTTGTFTLRYTLNGSLTAGLRGLTAVNNNGTVSLYAITADNVSNTNPQDKLVFIQDTLTNIDSAQAAGLTFATLATAPTNTAFRGVDFAPTLAPAPEPGSMAVMCLGVGGLGLLTVHRRRRQKKTFAEC